MSKTLIKRDIAEAIDEAEKLATPDKIKPLVVAFLVWGVTVIDSFEGSPIIRPYHPWIDIDLKSWDILMELLSLDWCPEGESKEKNQSGFVVMPFGKFLRVIPAWTNASLFAMQLTVTKFGKFLQDLPENYFE